jgi:hydroxymethylpyrimidine/phosphomethylpyrimidine kinase
MKRALTIAGSDCSGGAGIQADIKTFSAHGVFGMSVIVSVVAENTSRVIGWQDIEPGMIRSQIDAIYEDIGTDAVKIGMLSTASIMETVAEKLSDLGPANVVADPVMYAKNGAPLMAKGAIWALVKNIIPLADLVTPNIPEAEELARRTIGSAGDARKAAERIFAMGAGAVLIKGGHRDGVGESVDLLFDGKDFSPFSARRIPTKNTHGTGCTLSSAIAANLALGLPLGEAVGKAKAYVTTAIEHALELGKGAGPTHHFWDLYRRGLGA